MLSILKCVIAVLVLAGAPSVVSAQPINIQVTTDPAVNFNNLHFGQPDFTTYVNVSGVPAASLPYFSTGLTFNSAILSASMPVIAGPIAPDSPLDDYDFLDASATGEAAASYLSDTAPIVANGVFFSFTFHVLADGIGGVALNPMATFAIDGNDTSYESVSGSGLSLSLAVPEPSLVAAAMIFLPAVLRRRGCHRVG